MYQNIVCNAKRAISRLGCALIVVREERATVDFRSIIIVQKVLSSYFISSMKTFHTPMVTVKA